MMTEIILELAALLLSLINDILDMSRIESGRMTLKNDQFSFREFLNQIRIIINGQCEDKGLRFVCNLAEPLDEFFIGDDLKLKQVLINILGNSVKFTDPPQRDHLHRRAGGRPGRRYRPPALYHGGYRHRHGQGFHPQAV